MEPEPCADCARPKPLGSPAARPGGQITWAPLWQVWLCAGCLWVRTQKELWKECVVPGQG